MTKKMKDDSQGSVKGVGMKGKRRGGEVVLGEGFGSPVRWGGRREGVSCLGGI